MALNLGSVIGYLGLDAAGVDEGLDKASESIESGKSKFAAAAAGVGIAAGAALGVGLAGAMDAQDANAKLTAQLDLTAEESARAGKLAGKLYAGNYGESLDEVNDAVGAVMTSIKGMRTASSADVQALTTDALNLASAFDVEVGRSAQVAGQLITTGLAQNGTEAFDLLSAAMQRVPAAVREDVVDAADEYGPFFAQLGIAGKDAFSLLVEGAQQGAFGIDKTGDALKEFTIRAVDLGDTGAQQALTQLGLSGQDVANKLLAGGATAKTAFADIIGGLRDIKDPAQQSQAAIALFGTPLEDIGKGKIPAFLSALSGGSTAMDGFTGATDRMNTALGSTASSNIESFKRQLQQGLVTVVGTYVLPAFTALWQFLSANLGPAFAAVGAAVSAAGRFLTDHQGVAIALASVIGTVLLPVLVSWAVTSTVSAARSAAAWVMSGVSAVTSSWAQAGAAARVVAGWAATGAAAVVSGAQTDAIGTLYKVEAIKGAAITVASLARQSAAWVASRAVMLAGAAATGVVTAAQWLLNAALSANPIGIIIIAIVALVAALILAYKKSETFRAIVQAVFHAIGAAASWLWDTVLKPVFGWIGKAFAAVAAGVQYAWSHWIQPAWTAIAAAASWLWNSVLKPVFSFIGDHWKTILLAMLGPIGWLIAGWNKIKAAAVWLWNGLVATWTAISGAVKAAIDGIVGFVTGLVTGIVNAAVAVWNWFTALPGVIWGYVSGAASWLLDTGRKIVNGAYVGIVQAAAAVWNWFVGLSAKITGYLSGAGTWLVQKGKDLLTGAYNGIVAGATAVWSWFTGLAATAKSKIGDVTSSLVSVGKDIVTGIWSGISGAAGWLYDKIKGFITDLPGKIAGWLGIGSPSKVMRDEIGQWIPKGIAVGITGNAGVVDAAMRDLVSIPPVTVPSVAGLVRGGDGAAAGSTSAPGRRDGRGGGVRITNNIQGWEAREVERYNAMQIGPF